MIESMNHASFTVFDLENSIEFYRDVLKLRHLDTSGRDPGFSQSVTGIKDAHLEIAYFEANNCRVELVQYLEPNGIKIDTTTSNIGSAHMCFNVSNFDNFVDNLKKNHVTFTGEVSTIPAGPNRGKKVLYFEDPDSNTIEIISC